MTTFMRGDRARVAVFLNIAQFETVFSPKFTEIFLFETHETLILKSLLSRTK